MRPGPMRMQRRCTAGSSTADDQHIRGVLGREINVLLNRTVALQQGRQLDDGALISVGAKADRTIGARAVIRVVFMDKLIAVSCRELWKNLFTAGVPGLVYDLLKRVNVHVFSPSFVSSRAHRVILS